MNLKRTLTIGGFVAACMVAILGASLLVSPPVATQALEQVSAPGESQDDGGDDRAAVEPSPSASDDPSPEPSPSASDDDDDEGDDHGGNSGPGGGDEDEDDDSGSGSDD